MQRKNYSKGRSNIQNPRAVWENPINRTATQPTAQGRKCGPSRVAGLSSIALPAMVLPEIEVAALLGRVDMSQFNGVEKVLVDLFPIFMRHDQIREQAAGKKWKSDTPPWKVFVWLAERYLSLLPMNCNATIVADATGEYAIKNEYCYFEIPSQVYSSMFGGGTIWSMPVESLAVFEKLNPALWKLLMGMLILFENICGVPLFFNHYYYEMDMEWFAELLADSESETDRELIANTLEIYTNGPASRYEQILKAMSIKLDEFECLYNSMKVKTSQEEKFLGLATDALELFYGGSKMSDFVNHDDLYDKYPQGYISFFEYVFFSWSVNDILFEEVLERITGECNSGLEIAAPSISQVLTSKNKETVKPLKFYNQFPFMLVEFFEKASYICT